MNKFIPLWTVYSTSVKNILNFTNSNTEFVTSCYWICLNILWLKYNRLKCFSTTVYADAPPPHTYTHKDIMLPSSTFVKPEEDRGDTSVHFIASTMQHMGATTQNNNIFHRHALLFWCMTMGMCQDMRQIVTFCMCVYAQVLRLSSRFIIRLSSSQLMLVQ